MQPSARKVLIVGGGIAGLTLAIGLRQAGIAVDILEEQPAWRVLGVGISLTGPTLRALDSLGLIEQCVAVSFGYSQLLVFDREGAKVGAIELPRLNGPAFPARSRSNVGHCTMSCSQPRNGRALAYAWGCPRGRTAKTRMPSRSS